MTEIELEADAVVAPPLELRDGIPTPLTTAEEVREAARLLSLGTGPVALDAERASGYRYSARAYLVQLRRKGAGSFLIDPIDLGDLPELGEVLAGPEWILHAASQDLACLAELGLRPTRLFDTELAGRLLGLERVGLATMVHELLGFSLAKGHGAADWSSRPLPDAWLRYAALDVEVLIELRDILEERLRQAGKLEWAHEEFAALVGSRPPAPRLEPWRRTSGLHRIRKRRQLAVVRELWQARDRLARDRDTAPGRVLPDAAILEVALALPRDNAELAALPTYGARHLRRRAGLWADAVQRGLVTPDDELPTSAAAVDGPPPARSWTERDPVAARRLMLARTAMGALAEQLSMPVENVLSPDAVRRLTWSPPAGPQGADANGVAAFLREHGAREWQVGLTAPLLTEALRRGGLEEPEAAAPGGLPGEADTSGTTD